VVIACVSATRRGSDSRTHTFGHTLQASSEIQLFLAASLHMQTLTHRLYPQNLLEIPTFILMVKEKTWFANLLLGFLTQNYIN